MNHITFINIKFLYSDKMNCYWYHAIVNVPERNRLKAGKHELMYEYLFYKWFRKCFEEVKSRYLEFNM